MSKGLLSKRVAFLLILGVFIMLYASVTFHIPLLGNVGLVSYAVIVLSQTIKVDR
jgi:hypothetical protein